MLRLYVTGMTPRSTRAISTVRAVCEEHLAGRYELEIIDVYQQPARISDEQIFAIPTLVKYRPAPAAPHDRRHVAIARACWPGSDCPHELAA